MHRGNLRQQNGAAILPGHGNALQVSKALGAGDVTNQVLTAVQIDEPATHVARKAFQRRFDLIQGDTDLGHSHRIWLDPQGTHFAADRYHLRHASDRQDPWPQHEICIVAHLHRRSG